MGFWGFCDGGFVKRDFGRGDFVIEPKIPFYEFQLESPKVLLIQTLDIWTPTFNQLFCFLF